MADDEYDLLPHREIADLKDELEKLKKGNLPESKDSMEKLSNSINNLLTIFKEASVQMNLEEEEANLVAKHLEPIAEKIDKILDQNQKIAEGIVALADMVDDLKRKQDSPMRRSFQTETTTIRPEPMLQPFSPAPMNLPLMQPPPPMSSGPGMRRPLPPLPPLR